MAGKFRTRLAPTPSGFLHLGHARTFSETWRMARDQGGEIILRIEDIDRQRCRVEYENAVYRDLRWLGLDWDEGPDVGGPHASYRQSERFSWYQKAWERLRDGGWVYPSTASRSQIAACAKKKEADGMTTLFPEELSEGESVADLADSATSPGKMNWRFRVPKGKTITFEDGQCGSISYTAGIDFGDFLVWRKEDAPTYELAVMVDDNAMAITQVIRGKDLLLSTARQILLYEALDFPIPVFTHLELVCDSSGKRLSKTDKSTAIHKLRQSGLSREQIHALFHS